MGNYWYATGSSSVSETSFIKYVGDFISTHHSEEELKSALSALQQAEKKLLTLQSELVELKKRDEVVIVARPQVNPRQQVLNSRTPDFLAELREYFERQKTRESCEKKMELKPVPPKEKKSLPDLLRLALAKRREAIIKEKQD